MTPKTLNTSAIELSNPDNMVDFAKDLAKFIKEQKLSTSIQGRDYVNIEGWQYAGSRMGIMPIVDVVNNVGNDTEIKYEARVYLVNIHSGQRIGGGYALCSNKEGGKKHFAEYAIASMAQTRASGKAYRLLLSWVMKAAGYEGTPAEEMDFQQAEVVEEKKPKNSPPKEEPATEFATQEQKETIIRLLSHALINKEEKNKMLLNINKMDVERAQIAINKLKKTIQEREDEIYQLEQDKKEQLA